jgi:hypothetical protein
MASAAEMSAIQVQEKPGILKKIQEFSRKIKSYYRIAGRVLALAFCHCQGYPA